MTHTCFRCCFVSVAIPVATALSQTAVRLRASRLERDSPRSEQCGEFQGAWRREGDVLDQSDIAMCQDGKVLPQLYLLGPPKAGTTSLARDLASAGVECLADLKENFFWADHQNANLEDVVREDLEKLLKPCSETSRSVVADFTPENIAIPTLPKLMRSVYGSHHTDIRFVLMLREPLSRLQSHYYFGHDVAGKQVLPLQFQREVEELLDAGIPSSFTESMFPRSFPSLNELRPISEMAVYCRMGEHLNRWRASFQARQFLIIPYTSYLKNAADMKVCKGLSQHLGYSLGCLPHISSSISNPHPSVSHDVSKEVRKRFRETLKDDKKLLGGIIERDVEKGMRVLYYSGGDGSHWVHQNW